MNAERLHAVAAALRQEVTDTEYPSHLDQLATGLQGVVETPNQPGPQEQVSAARESLSDALIHAASNDFSPAWAETLKEMEVWNLRGDPLLEDVEMVLAENQITPSTAQTEIGQIRDRVNNFVAALDQLLSAFSFLDIGTEQLEPGEFEIGFLIPRVQVDDGLEKLGQEFMRLKKILAPFSELAGESRPEIKVRSISSSEFQVFLESTPGTALIIVGVLDRLLATYKSILDIRLKHKELAENPLLTEEQLKPLADAANAVMTKETRAIAEELIGQSKVAERERNNELLTEVQKQLDALADRIDRGYDVEVRAGALPAPVDGEAEEDGLSEEERNVTEVIFEKQKDLEFMNVTGKPILHLVDEADGDEEGSSRPAP